MKYSINSTGYIVAERDIYSLGGFIPKGSVGAKVANGNQISQEGECWVAGGDISGRPDVRVKDNAYIGNFAFSSGVHTGGITEFSGNTLIPGTVVVRNLEADPVNNFFAKDSFIGVSLDVLCGPATTTTAFPFEQGDFKAEAAKGTLFTSASMRLNDTSACRNTATLRLGQNTYLYLPTGYRARVFWAYYDVTNQLAYSGESAAVAAGLTKLDHLVYKLAMVVIAKADGTAMTPANLLATGAKILGHVSGSLLMDLRPGSVSGSYAMDGSSLIVKTSNFGLNATQLRFLAGGLFDSTMYTLDDRADYKIFGTFHNVQRLEYTKYLGDAHRTNVNRDRYISAYDCPLLRVDDNTFNTSLTDKGNLVLRRCVVPKAIFTDNIHNGNVYEDIDFSYASDHLGAKAGNNNDMWSSHKQGEYAAIGAGTAIAGLISRPENLAAGSVLGPGIDSIPLDGSLLEQGAYGGGSQIPYEEAKSASTIRIRTGKPVKTTGLSFPSLPAGYSVKAFYYLDEDFIIRSTITDPTSIDVSRPYVVMLFRRDNDSSINVADFIALGLSLRSNNYSNIPEITGSSYVGAGATVRGDVKLIGDPYVNRVLDVNMWERGNVKPLAGGTWQDGFFSTGVQYNRFRTKDLIPVEPGGTLSRANGGKLVAWFFDGDKKRTASSGTGWVTSFVVPENVSYVGMVADVNGDGLVTEDDISVAGIKYVRAFKKRRYITNELDRTSPEDILLSADYWEQGTATGGTADAGKTYEDLKATSGTTVRLKRPINVSPSASISTASGFTRGHRVLDALTKFVAGEPITSVKMALLAVVIQKAPPAAMGPSEIADSRLVLDFIPTPRIVTPYGFSSITVGGAKVRMYDNAVLSKPMDSTTQKGEIVLSGDAVARYDFVTVPCFCSNGHSDAIIKLP